MNGLKKIGVTLLLGLLSSSVMAYQVSVTDVSEKPHSHWGHLILTYSSLMVSVTLDTGESEELLDNVHVIAEQQGKFYQLNQMGTWDPIEFKGVFTSVPFKRSFQRAPWDKVNKLTVNQQVVLYGLYTKGTKIYVAARANDTAGFVENSIKPAYVVE